MPQPIAVYRSTLPLILWGAGYATTLTIGWPLERPETYPEPVDGFTTVERLGGEVDGWLPGTLRFLRATVASIPGTDEVGSYGLRSGWDSADGWSDFLAYARQARPIRFVPDADAPSEYVPCLLVEPWQEPPEPGWAVRRTITLLLRATDPSIPFEGY